MQNHPIINTISTKCTACGKCVSGCNFLKEHGNPAQIAASFRTGKMLPETPFECSLCGLCDNICPEKLDLHSFFHLLRQHAYKTKPSVINNAKPLTRYEAIGSSKLFSYFHLPEDGTSVFFPGCTLPATRPETVFSTFKKVAHVVKNCGIALTCCYRPSQSLGREDFFQKKISALITKLEEIGVKQVITACPNCYAVLTKQKRAFAVITVYEIFDGKLPKPFRPKRKNAPMLHDPCALRFAPHVQEAVRNLLDQQSLPYVEAKTPRHLSRCCGEGGGTGYFKPENAEHWLNNRLADIRLSGNSEAITSCAGCLRALNDHTNSEGQTTTVHHVLDMILNDSFQELPPSRTGLKRYTGRLKLKKQFKKHFSPNKKEPQQPQRPVHNPYAKEE
ncbi:MAG: (Fe-S)-binding protein [Desulfovibrio sp.]